MTMKGQQEGALCNDGIVLCIDCGGVYTNPHADRKLKEKKM